MLRDLTRTREQLQSLQCTTRTSRRLRTAGDGSKGSGRLKVTEYSAHCKETEIDCPTGGWDRTYHIFTK